MLTFHDHFSGHASDYASYRPRYPAALFQFLANACDRRDAAWDCATGSGQAAVALAQHFSTVIATDASANQIAAAQAADNVDYRVAPAETSGLQDASVDLITVAQALHWFDMPAFFAEAARVLRADGVLAVWSYEKCTVDATVDPVVDEIFAAVEHYWPPQRDIVMRRYADVQLPWPELESPAHAMVAQWDTTQMLGYLNTWSATKRYQRANGSNPVDEHAEALRNVWRSVRNVRWPLTVRICRKPR